MSEDCIFCKIASAKVSSRIVARDSHALAFLDAFPLSPGHVLVIPKSHYAKIEDMDNQSAESVFRLVHKLAGSVEKAAEAPATTIAVHNGKDAGQEIPHVHVHIIPRHVGDGAGPVHTMFKKRPKVSSDEMDVIALRISSGAEQSNT